MTTRLKRLLRDCRGATAIEYGLVVSLIVIAILVSLTTFAGSAIGMWNMVSREVVKHT